jgi:hypothetical protein
LWNESFFSASQLTRTPLDGPLSGQPARGPLWRDCRKRTTRPLQLVSGSKGRRSKPPDPARAPLGYDHARVRDRGGHSLCVSHAASVRSVRGPSDKRLKLAARVDQGMNLSPTRRSWTAACGSLLLLSGSRRHCYLVLGPVLAGGRLSIAPPYPSRSVSVRRRAFRQMPVMPRAMSRAAIAMEIVSPPALGSLNVMIELPT